MKKRDYTVCKMYGPMFERYDKAVEENDTETLKWFARFGSKGREAQMIENAQTYVQFLLCGYTGKPEMNDNGWLTNGNCALLKEKAETMQIFRDGPDYANIYILQHPNDKWISELNYMLSTSGGGAYPSIWSIQHDTRRAALNKSLDNLIDHLQRCTSQRDLKFLPMVRNMRGQTGQLSLFDDMNNIRTK